MTSAMVMTLTTTTTAVGAAAAHRPKHRHHLILPAADDALGGHCQGSALATAMLPPSWSSYQIHSIASEVFQNNRGGERTPNSTDSSVEAKFPAAAVVRQRHVMRGVNYPTRRKDARVQVNYPTRRKDARDATERRTGKLPDAMERRTGPKKKEGGGARSGFLSKFQRLAVNG